MDMKGDMKGRCGMPSEHVQRTEPSATGGRRLELYDAIRSRATAQRVALDRDDLDTFFDLLQERERLIALAEQTPESPSGRVPRSAVAATVRDILDIDEQNQRLLDEKLRVAARELAFLRSGQQAMAGYGRPAPIRSLYFERLS